MDVKLRLHLGDEGLHNIGDVLCVFLPSNCKMAGTVHNVKKSIGIVYASSKDIHKCNTLDGGAIAKNSHSKDPCFESSDVICCCLLVSWIASKYFPLISSPVGGL